MLSERNGRKSFFQKGESMKRKKSLVGTIVLSSAVGLVSSPVWSQEAPGETRQPNPNQTRPGRGEGNIPGGHQTGTPELSKNDMQKVEQALKAKGYNVGKIDGMADDDARKAIRSFQQDNGMPITGVVDQRTADRLGVRLSGKAGRSQDRSTSGMPERGTQSKSPRSQSGDDQSLPPSGTRR
jgi:peptidoglycan hydrolase-like protein with peptidoglycan-binding domain